MQPPPQQSPAGDSHSSSPSPPGLGEFTTHQGQVDSLSLPVAGQEEFPTSFTTPATENETETNAFEEPATDVSSIVSGLSAEDAFLNTRETVVEAPLHAPTPSRLVDYHALLGAERGVNSAAIPSGGQLSSPSPFRLNSASSTDSRLQERLSPTEYISPDDERTGESPLSAAGIIPPEEGPMENEHSLEEDPRNIELTVLVFYNFRPVPGDVLVDIDVYHIRFYQLGQLIWQIMYEFGLV